MATIRALLVLALASSTACLGPVDKTTGVDDGGKGSADSAMTDSAVTGDSAVWDAGVDDAGIPNDWAILTWTAPTENTDGTPLTDLAGYYVYHGMISPLTTMNSTKINVGNVLTYTFKNLVPGTHYFAVSDYTTDGTESGLSAIGSKTVP